MIDLSLPEVSRLVAAANAARWQSDVSGQAEDPGDAERQLDALFSTSHTLAVYGTLAPGQPNHHVVAPLGGEWTDGLVEGDLFPVGWGAILGYPAFRPRAGGAAVAVKVLTSPRLATAWPTLDRFEGPEYRRILVPVFRPDLEDERRLYTVANLYAAAEEGRMEPDDQIPVSQVLLITGASRGIGAATALLAGQRGHRVCVNYVRNREAAEAVAHSIVSAGGQAIAIAADVANEAGVSRMFETCDKAFGPVWGLVNNAGVLERQTRVDAMETGRLQRVFATNVFGAFSCAREAVRRMSTKHGGRGGAIVNVSSAASRLGSPGEYVDYAASKGAIDTFTVGLAKEVAEEGIRVNAVRPGFIYTDMHASGGEPDRVDRVKAVVPMRRGGTADEVARAVLWLLSDEASFTTGSFIDVSGGR